MKIFLTVLILIASSVSHADILFLDLNFSLNEVKAAQSAAQMRGEKIHVYPTRTPAQAQQIDTQRNLVEGLKNAWSDCEKNSGNDCSLLTKKLDLAMDRLTDMTSSMTKVTSEELTKILRDLKQQNVKLTSLIISGHSSGTFFAGLLGFLDQNDVKAAFANHPDMLSPIQSFLFWGCYTGTLYGLNNVWHANFPSVAFWPVTKIALL